MFHLTNTLHQKVLALLDPWSLLEYAWLMVPFNKYLLTILFLMFLLGKISNNVPPPTYTHTAPSKIYQHWQAKEL